MRSFFPAVASVWLVAQTASAQPAPAPAPPAPAPVPAPEPIDASKVELTPKGGTGSTALEAPPAPPAAGQPGDGKPPPPPLPRAFPDEAALALRDPSTGESVAGWHNFFFIRDPDGNFRISPTGMFQLDFHGFAGTNVDGVPRANGGAGLPPRFFARRLRFGFHGDFLKRWSFLGQFDIAPSVADGSGTDQLNNPPIGVDPTGETARYRGVQGVDAGFGLRDAWVNYSLCPCLNFQIGQFQPPMTQENRTNAQDLPLMERSIATRSFVVPGQRESGLQLWGDFGDDVFTYEIAVVGGDGQNRATVDSYPDVVGRFLVAPFKSFKLAKDIRLGVSGRHGQRDQLAVAYDVVPFTSNNGFVLWDPSYTDSAGRRVHVIPSGAQNTIGGEFLVPVGPVDIAGQAYYNAYRTREGVDGFQLTNTERLGALTGVGLTSWVTWWAFGDERIAGATGRMKPSKLNLKRKAELKRGLEVTALFSAILASYDGNSRGGEDDALTPGSADAPVTDINIFQFGGNLSYWHTRNVRMTFNYGLYLTPDSGTGENLAKVPGNLGPNADEGAELLHEFGTRLQLFY
jgi:hypothetical protein